MNDNTNDVQDQALKTVTALLEKSLASEIIGGVSLADTIDCVDLDIAYSPVVPFRVDGDYPFPKPCEVRKTMGDRYIVIHPAFTDSVSPDSLKIMRCRYLLWRGYAQKMIDAGTLSHSDEQEVVSRYFDGFAYKLRKEATR